MAKCKLLMQTAQTQKLIDFFDGYESNVKQNYHLMKLLLIAKDFSKRLLRELYYIFQFNQMVSLVKNKDNVLIFFFSIL